MGDRHHDPTDHFRTTQPHAGITMKDNLLWPGFLLLAVALSGMISTAAVAAYGHYEWLTTTVLIAVVGTVAGALWFLVELCRVARIDEQWLRRCLQFRRQPAASSENMPHLGDHPREPVTIRRVGDHPPDGAIHRAPIHADGHHPHSKQRPR